MFKITQMNMVRWKIDPPKPGRIAGLLFLLMACVHPLFLTQRGYRTITTDKYRFLLWAAGVCAALWVLWAVGEVRKERRLPLAAEGRPLAFRIADIAILAFLVGAVISSLQSGDMEQSLFGDYQRNDGLVTQGAYILIYFMLSRGFRPRRRHGGMMVAVVGMVWLYALLQSFDLDPLHLFDFEGYLPASGIPYTPFTMTFRTTLGNLNMLSTWAVTVTMVMGVLYVTDPWRWRRLWLLGSAFGFYTLLMASSDSGAVGLAGAMLLLLPWLVEKGEGLARLSRLCFVWSSAAVLFSLHFDVYGLKTATMTQVLTGKGAIASMVMGIAALAIGLWQRGKPRYPSPKTMHRIVVMVILTMVLLALAALLWLDTGESGTLYEAGQLLRGNFDDRFGSSRLFIWKRGWQAVSAKPWFGTGPDSFFRAFGPWQSEAYQVTGIYYDKAHNEYLQILVCQGLAGLVCWLAFLAACITGGLRKISQKATYLPLLGGILAYLIQGFFNISTPISTPILWILLGAWAGCGHTGQPEADAT